jgi:hypothetical protein
MKCEVHMSRHLLLFAVLAFVFAACASSLPVDGATIRWSDAVDLLHDGHVIGVTQLHSLTVYLSLTNGAEAQTVEPYIDAIFDEVQACGQPCAGIALATE